MAKPELTTLQSILQTVKNLFTRVDALPREVAYMMAETRHSEASVESYTEQEETVTPLEEEIVPPQEEEVQVTQDEKDNLQAELAAVRADLERLAGEKAEAERVAGEARQALEDKLTAEREAVTAAAQAAEVAREAQFAQMLSDRIVALTEKGIPPILAERAKNLIESLRSLIADEQTFVLSEGDEPTNIVDGVFSLLSEATATIDFTQHGVQPVESNTSDNPWIKRIAKAKAVK